MRSESCDLCENDGVLLEEGALITEQKMSDFTRLKRYMMDGVRQSFLPAASVGE